MNEIGSAVLVFVLLLTGTSAGVLVKPLLPEEHTAHETVQLIQLVIGMLVTFTALVMGLMTASAKNNFDTVGNDFRSYSADLIQLNATLREYGTEAAGVRQILRAYTAAAIASTWAQEPRPPGNYYPTNVPTAGGSEKLEDTQLGDMLNDAGQKLQQLKAPDAYHQRLLQVGIAQFQRIVEARWKLIEEAHSTISQPFFATLTFWLIIIFLSFGLIAPRNALALVMIMLGALSIASAVYVIVDLDTPFTGPIVISSQPMRDALVHLNRQD
ncbi:DUF4239 domain-containing protein [Paraburkholderia sp. DHOC27]|uniref:bestrophin-like domain n=1 Tax=Paraburkholderia sp. DHOC27 TaxID=2303330 RepID=UPI000E3E2331|nr:DUF4239 domain-containing protein [Paraburkholderia sp. DHOC27]RFU47049.1 DUF4239 domain-containing protein [Paraburkholderia sp. DHOC27]